MKFCSGLVLLALLKIIVVLARNNHHSPTDRNVKEAVSNSTLHKLWKRENLCPQDEYPTGTYCCKLCNAGTYAQSDCNAEHGNPKCDDCTTGETYMDTKNGNDHCLKCLQCDTKQGQEVQQACTVLTNTVCKCSENFFCTKHRTDQSGSCEQCDHCTQCEHGYAEACTATKDAVCKFKQQRHHYISLALCAAFILLLISIYSWALCIAKTHNPAQPIPVDLCPDIEPSPFPDDLKDIDLENQLFTFSENMDPDTVVLVVRKMGLPETRITDIRQDNKDQSLEIKYKLLKAWYDSRGRKGAFQELYRTLQNNQKQWIAENLIQIIRRNEQQLQS